MAIVLSFLFLSLFVASSLSAQPVEIGDGDLNFLMIGDWGGTASPPYYTDAEHVLAGVMGDKAQEIGSDFTVAMGDNFYTYGVKSVDDPRFKETFEVRNNLLALQAPSHALVLLLPTQFYLHLLKIFWFIGCIYC